MPWTLLSSTHACLIGTSRTARTVTGRHSFRREAGSLRTTPTDGQRWPSSESMTVWRRLGRLARVRAAPPRLQRRRHRCRRAPDPRTRRNSARTPALHGRRLPGLPRSGRASFLPDPLIWHVAWSAYSTMRHQHVPAGIGLWLERLPDSETPPGRRRLEPCPALVTRACAASRKLVGYRDDVVQVSRR